MNEGFGHNNLLDKSKKLKPKFQINNFVRTADLRNMFSKEIRLLGLINSIKLRKKIMIQYQVIKSIN